MRVNHASGWVAGVVALLAGAPAARAQLDGGTRDLLRGTVQAWLASRGAPGAAVGVVAGGQVVFAEGFGVASADRPDIPVAPRSLFHLASNSKPFVATAVLQLADRGLVHLDSAVQRYLPEFRIADERQRLMTVRQFLNHTSGMPDVDDYKWDQPEYDERALERYVRSLTTAQLIGAPGAEFSYSNMAYEVLGHLIARVSGETFESYVRRNILEPLDMRASTFYLPDADRVLLTDPHEWRLRPTVGAVRPYTRTHAPSSTLNASVREMCNWAVMNLNGGAFRDRVVLSGASHAAMWRPTVVTGWGGYDEQVGLAWFLGEYRGHRLVSHKGRDPGYGSMVALLPDLGVGVVVLANGDFAPVSQITEAVLDIMLGHRPPPPRSAARYALGPIVAVRGVAAAIERYRELKSDPSYDFDDVALHSLGVDVYRARGAAEALGLFRLNVQEHPQSWRSYDGLGGMYLVLGDTARALESYRTSVELNPDHARGRRMIERLEMQRDTVPRR